MKEPQSPRCYDCKQWLDPAKPYAVYSTVLKGEYTEGHLAWTVVCSPDCPELPAGVTAEWKIKGRALQGMIPHPSLRKES